MTMSEIISAAKELSEDDRRELIRELQETLLIEEETLPFAPEWMAEIRRRTVEMDARPERSRRWVQVRDEVLAEIAGHVGK